MSEVFEIEVVDVQVAGDLHRIVLGGIKDLPGATVLEKMQYLRDEADGLRRFLLEEPRGGHPSIYADLVVEPGNPEADAGFVIFEMMGYPKISGTNTMSTAIALFETGRLPMQDRFTAAKLESPGALINIEAECVGKKVTAITYESLTPSFVYREDLVADVAGYGPVRFDVVWTGAFYPVVDPGQVGLVMTVANEAVIVDFARKFVDAARTVVAPVHPVFGDEGPLTFLIFCGAATPAEDGGVRVPVTTYEYPKPGICRALAGVGTTAALVQLLHRNAAEVGDKLTATSPAGNELRAVGTGVAPVTGYTGYTVKVSGQGWITARSMLPVDFTDPMTPRDGLDKVLAGGPTSGQSRD